MKTRSRVNKLIALVLCIPLLFIIYFAFVYASQTLPLNEVYRVELTMPDGAQYVFEQNDDVAYFRDLLADAKEIHSPVRDVANENALKFVYIDTGSKLHFDFYPTLNTDGCMVHAENGKWYLLSKAAAMSFLCRSECRYLYSGSMTPTLNISDGEKTLNVYPSEYEWQYRKVDGNFYRDTVTPKYDGEVVRVYSTAEPTLSFVLEGGSFDISFSKDGQKLEEVHSLAELKFLTDTYLDVTVSGSWSQSSSSDYYGNAVYNFRLLYDVPAQAKLSQTTVIAGGFAAIKLENCCRDEDLTVTSSLYDGEIKIYSETDNSNTRYAIIPVSIEQPAGIYKIDFVADGYSSSAEITVNAFTPKNLVLLSETEEEYNTMLSREILDGVGETLLSAVGPKDDEVYFTLGDAFKSAVSGTQNGFYGDEYVVKTGGASYNLPGAVYSVAAGTPVHAAQRGVVVFAKATAATGNTVIIDHGYGIHSYYFNLSAISVEEGGIAAVGSVIGSSGSSGFTWHYDELLNVAAGGGDMFQFAVSINGVFVDNSLFASELNFQ